MIALVPMKQLARAKGRLAAALSPDDRASLALAMLHHVLDALAASRSVSRTILVCDDPIVAAACTGRDIDIADAVADGLNPAIAAVLATVDQEATILVLPADLPAILPADIAAIAYAGERADVVVVPSQDGGTNALLFRATGGMIPAFGPDSAMRHKDAAEALGLSVNLLDHPRLTLDIDSPADLAVWRTQAA